MVPTHHMLCGGWTEAERHLCAQSVWRAIILETMKGNKKSSQLKFLLKELTEGALGGPHVEFLSNKVHFIYIKFNHPFI